MMHPPKCLFFKEGYMKYLFFLGHPAHFHLFKNVIETLNKKNDRVFILIKTKDILEELLQRQGTPYVNTLTRERGDSKAGIALGVVKRDWRLLKFCLRERPDIMLGSSTEISHVGTLLRIPSVIFSEDDVSVIPAFSKLTYPLAHHILSPIVCDNGKWNAKSIKYEGYHELAYLHPNHFTPSREVVEQYFPVDKRFFIIRFAKLTAYHDTGIRGITDGVAERIIQILEPWGRVFITSERTLPGKFEPYRIAINPLDIHHVMAFASLYIGDSQTMATEAGVLGTPFIRFNDFIGQIGTLGELENKYQLGYGIRPDNTEALFKKIEELVNMENLKSVFAVRRKAMLKDKIDVAQFFTWFIEQYPESVQIMRDDPDMQYSFR